MTFDDLLECDDDVLSDDDDENGKGKDFDFRYQSGNQLSREPQSSASARDTEKGGGGFDSVWLNSMLLKYFEGNETALTLGMDELASTVYDVLATQRSDDELQNEVKNTCHLS